MERGQGQFGWITLDVQDPRGVYPAAHSEAGAFTTVDMGKTPVLSARKVGCMIRASAAFHTQHMNRQRCKYLVTVRKYQERVGVEKVGVGRDAARFSYE